MRSLDTPHLDLESWETPHVKQAVYSVALALSLVLSSPGTLTASGQYGLWSQEQEISRLDEKKNSFNDRDSTNSFSYILQQFDPDLFPGESIDSISHPDIAQRLSDTLVHVIQNSGQYSTEETLEIVLEWFLLFDQLVVDTQVNQSLPTEEYKLLLSDVESLRMSLVQDYSIPMEYVDMLPDDFSRR